MRHGETSWSLSGQYTGRADIPLTAHGEDEARQLGKRIRSIPFDHVLTSPLQRARHTGELAGLPQHAEIDPDLAEWDNGDYEGRTPAEVLASRPDWNLFRDGCPHGESPQQISARADRLIHRLTDLDGNVALFSHSHLGRVLAVRWIGLAVEHAQHLLLNTASLSVLCCEHDRSEERAIALWNSPPFDTFGALSNQDAGVTASLNERSIERWENEGGEILLPLQKPPKSTS
ncbi:histidine phosphatase family protein [Lignipirellula cremea]|nr:histidine phosphatase family protein [Lignipirellula cremea]